LQGRSEEELVARIEVKVPTYGMTESESYLLKWWVKAGQTVGEGEDLVDVETNKAETTLTAPVAGLVGDLLIGEEQDIPVGAVLTWVETEEAP